LLSQFSAEVGKLHECLATQFPSHFLQGTLKFRILVRDFNYIEIPNVLHVSRNVLLRSSSDISASFIAFVDPSVGSIQNSSMALSLARHPSGFRTRRLQRNQNSTVIVVYDLHIQHFFLDLFTDSSLYFSFIPFLCLPQIIYVDITFLLIRAQHFFVLSLPSLI
jgi:hypothetical protein